MKTNDVVNFEIANKLKNIGFNEPTQFAYGDLKYIHLYSNKEEMLQYWKNLSGGTSNFINNYNPDYCAAPLWQNVLLWFIEEYKLNGIVYIHNKKWTYEIQEVDNEFSVNYPDYFDTPQEARNELINRLIIKAKIINKIKKKL